MHKPTTLLCTVGTSLLKSNLERFDPRTFVSRLSSQDIARLTQQGLPPGSQKLSTIENQLERACKHDDWTAVADCLVELPMELRLLGAEINSIAAMCAKKLLSTPPTRLVLLVSDTHPGAQTGIILRRYFLSRNSPCRFDQVLVFTIEGLQDKEPQRFQQEGLPNLVRLLAEQTRQWSPSHIAINATGGYKAQIALAVAFGQVMGTPVYYKHELFNEIISFPKIPFTMDLSMVTRDIKFWSRIAEPGAIFTYEDLRQFTEPDSTTWEAMLPLMEIIEEDGRPLYALSALGLIYWEAYLSQHPALTLKPGKAEIRRGCRFRDDHYPIGFKHWAENVYLAHDFITECHSMEYSGQQGIQKGFEIKNNKIIGSYKDKNGFSAKIEVMTTCANELERKWALDCLNTFIE